MTSGIVSLTTEPPGEYWSTQAQVISALAIALVIEVRAIRRAWHLDTPRLLRAIQSFIWVLIGATLFLGLSASFRALRGEPVSETWASLTENAVFSAVGLLVLGPI